MSRHRKLLAYVLHQRRTMVAIGTLTLLSSATAALQPWPMKLLVDYALGDSRPPDALLDWAAVVGIEPGATVLVVTAASAALALYLLSSALGAGLSLAWVAGGQRMVYSLAADLFYRLQRTSLQFHRRRSIGDSLSRLIDDTWCVYSVTNGLLISPIQQLLTLAAVGAVALTLDPLLTALVLVTALLLGASAAFFGRRLKERARRSREAKSRLMSFVHQTLGAIPVVQAFSTEQLNRDRFEHLAGESVVAIQRGNLANRSFGLVNSLITTCGTAVVLIAGGLRVLSGEITLGSLLVFIAYLRTMQKASASLFRTFAKMKAAGASIDRVFEVIETDDRVRDATDALPLPTDVRGHVRFEGVSFGHDPGSPVIEDLDLEALPGETIALVGPTGAGKSTLVSLIPRFADPWGGRVTVDGLDLATVRLADLRQNVSLVLQEDLLLPLSVADNIAYGRPDAGRDEIERAALAARADAFIRRLPDGYETLLGEMGSTLSGGERQRVAIARALLKDAPILILDEPTSALDTSTEVALMENLTRLGKDRTTFIVAHRLSTIRNATRIVVLIDGRIVETGTHTELMDRRDHYWRLYTEQVSPETPEVVA